MSETAGCGQFIESDESITRFSTGHYAQRMTVTPRYIGVEDPWLGDFVITDQLMIDFHTTPLAYRATAISQLCKSRESSTMPNLASFTREAGLIAQNHLVEYFGTKQGLSREEILAIHVATQGDDQAHTAFSHELELAIQKWGGPQNYHEVIYPHIADLGGTTAVLKKHNVQYDEDIRVPGFKIPEWAHATNRKDLDIDRLQYIATEAFLWFDHDYVHPEARRKVKEALQLENFEITDEGKLAVKDAAHALVISKLFMLFSSEHWNDPINRAHLHLGIHGVQRSVLTRRLAWMEEVDRGETREPSSYFYGIDQDFTDALETGPGHADDFVYLISNVLNHSGMEERRRFMDYRLAEYSRFILDDAAENYPSEYLEPKRVEFGPTSSIVSTEAVELTDEQRERIENVKIPKLEDADDNLSYIAGPLKNRYIDPLVRTASGYKRLSEVRVDTYKKLLHEHQYLQSLGIKVTFAFTAAYAEEFREGMSRNDKEFEGLTAHSEMTRDQQRRVIELAAERAKKLSQAAGTLIIKDQAA